jgi:predicted ATPase/DNA-binding CsgD family transcriptional regulator/Tfp pilus assembly protein PilF
VRDPALALAELAAGLGVRARPGLAESAVIVDAMRDASGALLLDTCEHVAGSLRPLLRQLLEAAPSVQVLATSQVPLEVPGEQVWRVPGFGLPAELVNRQTRAVEEVTPEVAARCDAVQFFLARTRQRAPAFVPGPAALLDIAQICVRLDGIPLALGLAAAWMGAASPAELLRRWEERAELLADATAEPERHRTLQSAIQWSADLLTSDDQALVARFSAFIGPFTIADAEAVGTGLSEARLLTGVRRLVDVSWLDFVPDSRQPHYVMLDPLRDWGAAELGKRGQAEVAWRLHAEHFRELCRQAEADRFHIDPGDWPWRLGLQAGNIQAALVRCAWLDPETGAELAVSLLGWWRLSGRLAEGRHWLQVLSSAAVSDQACARAQCSAALLAMDVGDYGDAERLAAQAMTVLEEQNDARWLGRTLTALSSAAKYRGHMGDAKKYLEEALKHQQKTGDQRELAATLNNLGSLAADQRDLQGAERYYQLSLQAKRGHDDDRSTALTIANLADIATLSGRFADARALLDQGMALVDRLDDDFLRAFLRINLGENLLRDGNAADALMPFREALAYAVAAAAGRFRLLATCGLGEALCVTGSRPEGMRLLRECQRAAEQIGDEIMLSQANAAIQAASSRRRARILPSYHLTGREEQVMELVKSGLRNRAIAGQLGLSEATVQRHLSNIYLKLDVDNRTAAVQRWSQPRPQSSAS